MAKVCQALVHTRSSERVGEAWASSCLLLCGRIGTVAKAVPRQSCTNVSEVVAMVCRAKTVRTYRTVAKAMPWQSCADVSRR